MARSVRSSQLETRSARLRLTARRKPYWVTISPGISLGYRAGPGSWNVRCADGAGGNWTKSFAIADDHEEADGEAVLTYWAAIDKARLLARGQDHHGKPGTVQEALADYANDLVARGAHVANARRVLVHLPPALLAKPIGLLSMRELRRWRDNLLAAGMTAATLTRTVNALKSALNLAAEHDPRIDNARAWRDGLTKVVNEDEERDRNVVLDPEQRRALLAACYVESPEFGLYAETLAVTGARPSQVVLLDVRDLQDGAAPRLLLLSSLKGRKRRSSKRSKRTAQPIPISRELAAKLRIAAQGRAPDQPLLVRPDGSRWQSESSDHRYPFARAAAAAGLSEVTIYALRHTAITNALLANVNVRIVAAAFDTSVAMIEKTYSRHIVRHGDELLRALFKEDEPAVLGDNVVALR
jgi:integrase